MDSTTIYTLVFLAWLVGAAAFVLGLHQMNSPATARRGNQLSAAGMALAVLVTFLWLLTPGNPIRPGGTVGRSRSASSSSASCSVAASACGWRARVADDGHAAARVALQRGRRRRGRTRRDR